MTTEDLQSLDLLVLFDDHHEIFSTHTSSEATGMNRITTVLATVLSFMAITPLAAQENDCDGWMSSDREVTEQFWEAVTSEKVSDCLKSGSDINAKDDDGASPLHLAAFNNENPDVLTVLLNAGADVNGRGRFGGTPLLFAAFRNENPNVLKALLDAGADLNARISTGNTPLHLVAENNVNPEVLTVLLDAGADATAVNEDGETPFDLAKDNEALVGTDAYWALNDARFE